jgi:hypothetical protein
MPIAGVNGATDFSFTSTFQFDGSTSQLLRGYNYIAVDHNDDAIIAWAPGDNNGPL